ncbi:MAG: alpha/beta hydrolase [Rubrobacteraceae bacterium]|jgi:pimeloyl-ACP methyl ester carboxylesterase|nr:alpha/beta hydrolase [Rubrobacteraceae bacterium]
MEVRLADGRSATYEVLGNGPPLLSFVGGPGMPARFMRPDARLFAERFSCYLIDPHGSGGSTPPREDSAYNHEGHARFYEEVRRALNLGQVSVHGASFAVGVELDEEEGGDAAVAMEAALARHAEAPWYPEARRIWDDWTPRALAATDPGEVEDMLATVLPLYTAFPGRPEVREALEEARTMLAVDLRAVKVWEGGLYQRGDIRPLLSRVRCPTLVVCGELDLIGGLAQARHLVAGVPGAELLVIPNCGHFPALERPPFYRDAVLNWCAEHPAGL